jgi:hypothetical protein
MVPVLISLVTERVGSKYPPAKPEALRLLVPQRDLIVTGKNNSKNKSKSLAVLSSLPL